MRISDWSSDVCSSDLLGGYVQGHDLVEVVVLALADLAGGHRRGTADRAIEQLHLRLHHGLAAGLLRLGELAFRSEEHTSELQSLMRISYAVFCLYKKNIKKHTA